MGSAVEWFGPEVPPAVDVVATPDETHSNIASELITAGLWLRELLASTAAVVAGVRSQLPGFRKTTKPAWNRNSCRVGCLPDDVSLRSNPVGFRASVCTVFVGFRDEAYV